MQPNHPCIEVRDLRKRYTNGHQALCGIDLQVDRGVYGLLSPNGAGKSTLLAILALRLQPSSGCRTYFGVDDQPRNRPRLRPILGYLPQAFHPLGSLSGREYLIACGRVRRLPLNRAELERRVALLLAEVGLDTAARQRSGHYSGGMRRRLGVAQALLHEPRCLFVDEPSVGLDPEERKRLQSVFADLGERIPIVLSSHVVDDVEAVCSRLGVLLGGSLLFDSTPLGLIRWAQEAACRAAAPAAEDHDDDPPPGLETAYSLFLENGSQGAQETTAPEAPAA